MKFHKNQPFFSSGLLHIGILTVTVIVLYASTLFSAFVSDDINGIVKNNTIGNISFALRNPLFSFRPVLYAITYHLGGLDPFPFHVVNIFLHTTTVLSLYVFVRLLSGPMIGFLAAALFAVHPIATESVAWISAGSYPLYATFLFLSLSFYVMAQRKHTYFLLSLAAYFFALLSSEKTVVLPVVLVILELSFYDLKKNWKKIMPFGVIAFFYLFILFSNLMSRVTTLYSEHSHATSIQNPLLQAGIAITSYIRLLVWPDKLTLFHTDYTVLGINTAISVIFLALFIIALPVAYQKSKKVFFWMAFFLISLSPTFIPLTVVSLVAERYVYVGTASFVFILAFLLQKLSKRHLFVSIGIFCILILVYGQRTLIRNSDWKNEETLWESVGRVTPNSFVNYLNLGSLYISRQQYDKAVEQYEMAIQSNPNSATPYHGLGVVYLQKGQKEKALSYFEKAITVNPAYYASYQNLAILYFENKKIEEAEEILKKALKFSPENPDLHLNLGILYLKLGRIPEAKREFKITLQYDPSNQKALKGLQITGE